MTCPHDFTPDEMIGERMDEFNPGLLDSKQEAVLGEWGEGVRAGDLPEPVKEPVAYLHVNRSTVLLRNAAQADLTDALAYIRGHSLINHIHLSGTDCFQMPVERLGEIVSSLRGIDHVQMIRLHSRLPITEPSRISGNKALHGLIGRHSKPGKGIYMMLRIRHPEEITESVVAAFRSLHEAGASLIAEIPLVAGVNDNIEVMSELMGLLIQADIIPYQLVLDKPVPGQEREAVDLERAYRLTEAVKNRSMGLGRRIRLSLLRTDGLTEILAVENGKVYLKWHSSPEEVGGRFLIVDSRKHSLWAEGLLSIASIAEESDSRLRTPAADIEISSGYLPSNKTYLKTPHEIPD